MFQTLALSPPLLAILILLITPPAHTTEPATLTGIVRDQNTGEGLPYATLLITQDAHKQSLATDLYGKFQLSNLKPGTCHLKAIFIGYRSQTQVHTLQAGQKYPIELDLEPDPILLKAETDPQTVSAKNLMRRLIQQDRVGFLHMQYKDVRDYAFSAHAIQEVQRRYREKNLGNLEYYIQGYYREPEQYKQRIVGFRKSGTWRFSMSPGITDSPAKGTVGKGTFEISPHPLEPKGLESYHFETVATVQMGDIQIARISVSPRKSRQPGLIGYVWVEVGNAALVGYDLRLNQSAMMQAQPLKHWQVYQQNALFYSRYWLPIRQIWDIHSTSVAGKTTIEFYHYNLNPGVEDKHFKGPDLQILPEATHRDSTFWTTYAAGLDTLHTHYEKTLSNTDLPAAWSRSLGQ